MERHQIMSLQTIFTTCSDLLEGHPRQLARDRIKLIGQSSYSFKQLSQPVTIKLKLGIHLEKLKIKSSKFASQICLILTSILSLEYVVVPMQSSSSFWVSLISHHLLVQYTLEQYLNYLQTCNRTSGDLGLPFTLCKCTYVCVSGGQKCQFFGNFAYVFKGWALTTNSCSNPIKMNELLDIVF